MFDEILVDGLSCVLGQFEFYRPAGLSLANNGAVHTLAIGAHFVGFKPHHVATSQFAIDGHIEQGKIPDLVCQLQSGTDCPDMLRLKRGLLTGQLAFVRRDVISG